MVSSTNRNQLLEAQITLAWAPVTGTRSVILVFTWILNLTFLAEYYASLSNWRSSHGTINWTLSFKNRWSGQENGLLATLNYVLFTKWLKPCDAHPHVLTNAEIINGCHFTWLPTVLVHVVHMTLIHNNSNNTCYMENECISSLT